MARINVTSFLAVLLLLGVLANAVPVAHDHDDHSSDALDLNSMTGLQMEDISNQGVQDGLKVRRHVIAPFFHPTVPSPPPSPIILRRENQSYGKHTILTHRNRPPRRSRPVRTLRAPPRRRPTVPTSLPVPSRPPPNSPPRRRSRRSPRGPSLICPSSVGSLVADSSAKILRGWPE